MLTNDIKQYWDDLLGFSVSLILSTLFVSAWIKYCRTYKVKRKILIIGISMVGFVGILVGIVIGALVADWVERR
jgi:hypothetical protein